MTLPLRSDCKLATSLFDAVECIDLTGDIDLCLSSSSITDFGEPRPLRTEDAATHEGPRGKRGTKRKIEDYTSDLLSSAKYLTKIRTPSRANMSPTSGDTIAELPAASSRTSRASPLNVAKQPRRNYSNPPQNHRK